MVGRYRSLIRDVVFAFERLRNHIVDYATMYVREASRVPDGNRSVAHDPRP